jgi:hypothetical protein
MSPFYLWFTTGVEHITDLNGYDHILFVILLVVSFPLDKWKKLLLLITGFTIGHSIALALSVTNCINVPQKIIEVLIVLTILITAIYNSINYKKKQTKKSWLMYFFITCFGGIHGLGFSYLLRSMLGHEKSLALPLLYFNIGIEAGQLIIVVIVLVFSLLLTSVIKFPFHYFKLTISCLVALITLKMLAERLPLLF